MKYRVLAVMALLCLVVVGCKSKPTQINIDSIEQFEEHPTWKEDNPDAFWE